MHPAYSVIFFTVGSGLGYGLLIWLTVVEWIGAAALTTGARLITLAVALALVTAGLVSSMAHLGHPERAWRAVSQWRSSWLSREGVAAMISYVPALALGWSWWQGSGSATAAGLTVLVALATVVCTGMIYASLRPIPAWRHPLVVPVYVAMSLATGGALYGAIAAGAGAPSRGLWLGIAAVIAVCWGLKLVYWRAMSRPSRPAIPGSAIGIPRATDVRLFSRPSTGEQFVTREMGYRVARRHATRLRLLAITIGGILSLVFTLAAAVGGVAGALLAGVAAAAGVIGALLERWLFFAEARHVVAVYFNDSATTGRYDPAPS